MTLPKPDLKIGSTVWYWDENRRVYPKNGGIGSGPIEREHWHPVTIFGENKLNWLAGYERHPLRINKKDPRGEGEKYPPALLFSEAEIDRWAANQAVKREVLERVSWSRHRDITEDQFAAIARILGIKVPPNV